MTLCTELDTEHLSPAGGRLSGIIPRNEGLCISGGTLLYPELDGRMSSLCWFPWYPNRWFGSLSSRSMTLEEKGAYRELLDWQWQGQGYLPADIDEINRIVGFDVNRFPRVLARFPIIDGKRANPVLLTIWGEQSKKHKHRVDSAGKRWNKKQDKEETDTDTEDNAHALHDALHSDVITASKQEEALKVKNVELEFEECWKLYPDKSGKSVAFKAFKKALNEGTTQADVLAGLNRYIAYVRHRQSTDFKDLKFKNGATWFNQRGWTDESTLDIKPKKQLLQI